jgi:hypothetical protein
MTKGNMPWNDNEIMPVTNHVYCLRKDGRVSFFWLNKKGGDENVLYGDRDMAN